MICFKDYLLEKNKEYKFKKLTFVRFGEGLSSKKFKAGQTFGDFNKTDGWSKGFHSPPKRKGIYAFPEYLVDHFLWSWKLIHHKNSYNSALKRLEKIYGDFDNIPEHEIERINKEYDDEKLFKQEYKKLKKTFEYSGYLWHHFIDDVSPGSNIKGTWAESDTTEYYRILKKNFAKDIKDLRQTINQYGFNKTIFNIKHPYKESSLSIGKEHLEVFIEKVN